MHFGPPTAQTVFFLPLLPTPWKSRDTGEEKKHYCIGKKKHNLSSRTGLGKVFTMSKKERENSCSLYSKQLKKKKTCVSYVAPSTSFASEGPCPSRVGARTQNVPYRNCPGKCLVFPQCDPAHTKPSPAFTPTQALLWPVLGGDWQTSAVLCPLLAPDLRLLLLHLRKTSVFTPSLFLLSCCFAFLIIRPFFFFIFTLTVDVNEGVTEGGCTGAKYWAVWD